MYLFPGVEIQCIGHFHLLFGLLSVDSCKPIQRGALNVISSVTRNQECVNDIAASDVLVHLLLTLYSLPDAQITTLETLYALMHTTRIVKDALAKGEHVHHPFQYCPKDTSALFHSPVL
jgi:DnaJ family protein C protein 13